MWGVGAWPEKWNLSRGIALGSGQPERGERSRTKKGFNFDGHSWGGGYAKFSCKS